MGNEIVKAATDAATALTSDLYRDLLRPSTMRVGLSLETLTKLALSPISLLDWGFEQSKDWLLEKMQNRLHRTPPEYIQTPPTHIVSSALQHIASSNDTPELRELYAELLFKAMDARTASDVHPAYFYIVEQLAPYEALVLVALHQRDAEELFKVSINISSRQTDGNPPIGAQFREYCERLLGEQAKHSNVWLKNLCRLGVLELQTHEEAIFKPDDSFLRKSDEPQVQNITHQVLIFTDFGKQFISACAPINSPA